MATKYFFVSSLQLSYIQDLIILTNNLLDHNIHTSTYFFLLCFQVQGIKFLWKTVFESVERANATAGSGAILAHCMGLGKSLQIVSIVHTILTHPEIKIKTVIIVTPLSTVENWKNEFAMWTNCIKDGNDLNVYDMST